MRAARLVAAAVAATFMLGVSMVAKGAAREPRVTETVEIGKVWSGHPVGFALLTHGDKQYVAYYDEQRRMVVASRELGSDSWQKQVLPTSVGWDSHNYITMTLDDAGQLHVAGNMHVTPLMYFRTTRPGDITSLERVAHMVGTEEQHCTYPRFFHGPTGELLFTYRDGGSGNGNQIYNRWDGKQWHRLLDRPLTDGEGHRNAYLVGPDKGPDGYYHLVWVWRESPDCVTNHDLSYARSRDLVHWEKADGSPVQLPMTLENAGVVDPVPQRGGLVNGNTVVGFDEQNRVVIGYHKYDANGNTQIYNARLEDGKWHIYQTSDWNWRWEFGGVGSIPFEVGLGPVKVKDGVLTQAWRNAHYGSGTWRLDPATLKAVGSVAETSTWPPAELKKVESSVPGMQVKWAADLGSSGKKGVKYVLRWETLGINRDKPRPGPAPEPTVLRLIKVEE